VPLTNLGFETAGTSPGLAASWTFVVTSSYEEYADYFVSASYRQAWDGFEFEWNNAGWQTGLSPATALAQYSAAILNPAPEFEAFLYGWNVEMWLSELGATAAANYDSPVSEAFEDFGEGWSNDTWTLGLGTTVTAEYAPASDEVEEFEEGWANDAWTTSIGVTTTASFDGLAPEAFEDFEEVIAPIAVTIDPTANTLTATAHGLSNGTKVNYRCSARAAAGLSPELDYFVVNAAANTLQLSPISGGTAVDIGDQGGGTHEVLVDPSRYWNELLD
jgi:hypothetical protein